jgi:hypothetical protein
MKIELAKDLEKEAIKATVEQNKTKKLTLAELTELVMLICKKLGIK